MEAKQIENGFRIETGFHDYYFNYVIRDNKWFMLITDSDEKPVASEIALKSKPYVVNDAFIKKVKSKFSEFHDTNKINIILEEISVILNANELKKIADKKRQEIVAQTGGEFIAKFISISETGDVLFDRSKLAKYLTDKYNARIVPEKRYMYIYDYVNKFYSIDYGNTIETDLVSMFGNDMTTYELKEIMSQVWHNKDHHVREETLHWKNNTLINFDNCVLDIETMKKHKHDPDKYFFKNIINHKYNPNAKCPNILKLMERIFATDIEVKNQFEWVGFCLTPGYKFKAINIYKGDSDTGKSTFFNLIIYMVGDHNKCAVAPQEIKEPYNIDRYHGRMVNIAPDIGNDRIKNFNMLRMLSGGDPMTGRAIYGSPYEFINSAKIMISCNDIPDFDGVQASYNRVNIIHCDTVFTKDDIKNFDMDLYLNEEEISGFINEGIRAYKDTIERGGFIKLNSEDTADKHDFMVNGLDNWAMDELIWCKNDESSLWMMELENSYKNWCERNKFKPQVVGKAFTRVFREKFRSGYYFKEKRLSIEGKQRVKVFGVRSVPKIE